MRDRFSPMGARLLEAWQLMPLGQRLTVLLLALFLAATAGAMGVWASSPEYEPVFSGGEDEAAAAVAQVRTAGIPYRLSPNGRTVLAPSDKAPDARLLLGSAGSAVRHGQAGFELFNQANFGMTDQVQRINYQRALEGELARSLRQIEGVVDARVHVVLPAATLFTQKRNDPTVSVVLSTRGGRQLGDEQVQSVLNLMLGGVEGLRPENVSIVDTKGRVLNDLSAKGSATGGARATTTQYQQQRRLEADLGASLTTMLERLAGPGNAVVRVSAALDWDQVETQRELFEPAGSNGAVRNQRQQAETSTTGTAAAGGVPGTASNLPTYQAPAASPASVGYERKDNVTSYELNKTVERTVRSPGTLKSLSVMAAVDEKSLPQGVTAESLEKLLATAASTDPKRGDSVTVSLIPFTNAFLKEEVKALEEAQQREFVVGLARTGALAVVPIVLLILLKVFLGRSTPAWQGRVQIATEGPEELADRLAPEDRRVKLARGRVVDLAKTEPRAVSALLNTWLQDEGR